MHSTRKRLSAPPARSRTHLSTAALLAPACIFLLLNFVTPIVAMLGRGVTDPELSANWPRAAVALRAWRATGLPDDALASVVAADMLKSKTEGTLGRVAARINFAMVGSRSLIVATASALQNEGAPVTLARLRSIDPRWGDRETWAALHNASGPMTGFYLLAAADRRKDSYGHVTPVAAEQRVFVDVLLRTLKISAVVTGLCLLLGYPTAFLLAGLPGRPAKALLLLVILPFWTSVLVRTTAWTVLLQSHGPINETLHTLHLIDTPLDLIYNRVGVYIAMTHVLLPFAILPLYGIMKGIPVDGLRAARSLGASALTTFCRVYLPQSRSGIVSAGIIVFTLALGFYVTPALVGGGADQMISAFITFYVNQSLNWGMAAALSLLLLAALLVVLLATRCVLRPAPVPRL